MKKIAAALLAATLALIAPPGIAQSFPAGPVRLVVPFPPGGPADALARYLGEKLNSRWDKAVIIDNRPGGNTVIGAEVVARAAPDGHTLLMAVDSTLTMNQTLYTKLSYDPLKDFAAVTLASTVPLVLLGRSGIPAKDTKELVRLVNANPEKWNYGAGTISTQLAGELFNRIAGTKIGYVPYKGSGGTFPAILSNQVPMIFDGIGPALPHIKAGKLRALGTTGPRRSPAMPELPTFLEQGFKDYELVTWLGIVAPAGTPRPVINKLNADINAVLAMADIKERLLSFGMDTASSTPEEFTRLIQTDTERYGKLLKDFGIHLQ